MLKKLLTSLLLLSSFSIAYELKLTGYPNFVNGVSDIKIIYNNYEEYKAKQNTTDWIAVYKKGTPTNWENVLTWAWVKDLPGIGLRHIERTFSDTRFTEPGEYEVRYFENNSYTIDQAINFTVKEVASYLDEVYVSPNGDPIKKVELKGFDGQNFKPSKHDWIGIYEIADDNSWSNVLQWAWVENLKTTSSGRYHLNLEEDKYSNGTQYQARYFLNNSFTTYKESVPFYVGEVPVEGKKMITCTEVNEKQNGEKEFVACLHPDYLKEESKTWIGIFRKDANQASYENLIAWAYVNKDEDNSTTRTLKVIQPDLLIEGDVYETMFFINNHYQQLGEAFMFTLK